MKEDLINFCKDFDVVENAMQMRTLIRWNGRDLREKENLSEHTHLVLACAIKIYDELVKKKPMFWQSVDFEKMVRRCMFHDSLELLRGDILSITKDTISGLREQTESEERVFMETICGKCNHITMELVVLADLMACYKFIEYELRFPSNDFAINVYKDVKGKFDTYYKNFLEKYDFDVSKSFSAPSFDFARGYEDDAGIDVILQEEAVFMPMSTTTFGLKVKITPGQKEMGVLCSRTSAASKGLIVAMCPIDPNYSGEVMAIVHNVSNSIIKYKKGEAFCQVVTIPFNETSSNGTIITKKQGKRSDGKLGSTGK